MLSVADRVQRRRLVAREREKARERELEQAREIERAHEELEEVHAHLKAAQQQLVRQEKLASQGQLTAGIANEIKNPLNFVNNFAGLSKELVDEVLAGIRTGDTGEVEVLPADLGSKGTASVPTRSSEA